jgi:hypothetical protein
MDADEGVVFAQLTVLDYMQTAAGAEMLTDEPPNESVTMHRVPSFESLHSRVSNLQIRDSSLKMQVSSLKY